MGDERGGIGAAPRSSAPTLLDEHRAAPPPRWVHYLAVATAGLTFVLICAGGLVKSMEAGLSVPDWPLSYGQPQKSIVIGLFAATLALGLLWIVTRKKAAAVLAILCGMALASTYYFFGPMPGWINVPNVNAEHGHRLLAGTVGFLTAILVCSIWATDRRSWMRTLSLVAMGSVVVQAVLGGVTVHLLLPPLVSASHGSLAQAFFAMLVTLAAATSPGWFAESKPVPQTDRKPLQKMALMMAIALFVQVMLGAAVRHTRYYPEVNGTGTTFAWHLGAHLAGLLWVGHTVATVFVRIIRRHSEDAFLAKPATLLAALLGLQIMLGIWALFFRLTATVEYDPNALKLLITTAHVAGGALSLVTAVYIMLQSYRRVARLPLSAQPEQAGAADSGLASTGSAS